MTRTSLRTMAAAAIVTLLAAALVPAPSASAEQPAARANYQVPRVGTCYHLKAKQVADFSVRQRSVPCSARHTGMTIAVKRLSGSVNWDDKSALYSKIHRKCWNALERRLGSNDLVRSQTAYSWFWFAPSTSQRKHGAKWLRCDVALIANRSLRPMTEDLTLQTPLTDRERRCLTTRGYVTTCQRPHAFRSAGAYRIAGARPSFEQALASARSRCGRFLTAPRFTFRYPGADEWAAGSRAMVCYDHTTR